MNQYPPLCYGFTFSTYGTRLLGDERGATRWDGTRFSRNDPLKEYMEDNLNDQAFVMSFKQRAVAHDAIFDAAYRRRFYIDALNVRTTHVHLVVCSFDGLSGAEIIRFVKNDVRRALEPSVNRERIERIWTKGFAQSIIHDVGSWRWRVQYALFRQGPNDYMTRTRFAKRAGLVDPNNPTALRAAFHVEKNALYRMRLFEQMNESEFDDETGNEGSL